MYPLSSMPTARRWVGRLVVICTGVVNVSSPFYPPTTCRTLGNKSPDPLASAHCMYYAACRYSTTAATAQISRQSYVLPVHSRLGGPSQRLSEQQCESESFAPPSSAPPCDATTTRCQLLSPASEPYLDRALSVAHVPVIARSDLVVGVYSKQTAS